MNEEKLNRLFIDRYGLACVIEPGVNRRDITVSRIYDTQEDIEQDIQGNPYVLTREDVVKHLLSYAVGCVFGRFSPHSTGVQTGTVQANELAVADRFSPQNDNCVMLTDESYLENDLYSRVLDFFKQIFGCEDLDENMEFLGSVLGGSHQTSQQQLRQYLLNDFIKISVKMYKKRPIYWQFDSGKKRGFRALAYMHRWSPDLVSLVRVDYLHRLQRIYEGEIIRLDDMVAHSDTDWERNRVDKCKTKLMGQLKETMKFDENLISLSPRPHRHRSRRRRQSQSCQWYRCLPMGKIKILTTI